MHKALKPDFFRCAACGVYLQPGQVGARLQGGGGGLRRMVGAFKGTVPLDFRSKDSGSFR
jgi:hypothetical protein